MDESSNTTFVTKRCEQTDDLGYNLISLYNVLFGISCVTVPLGVLVNIVFVIGIICRAKQVFNIYSHALLLSCMAQVILAFVQGPIRVYYYYHHGCLPIAGSPLCYLTVYLDYIPTQINNFLIAQLSIERLFIILKPFVFHRRRHQNYSLSICLHYAGLFVAIVSPCLYYPIIMQNGASTIDLDDPSSTQTCDLWYSRDIYDTFDLLITCVPYFLILTSCLCVIVIFVCRKYVCGNRRRRHVGTRTDRRILLSIHLFLFWFVLTWSPWVLYDFFQSILNVTYSVYIDAITTFIVYLYYTFSSSIVLITAKEFRCFYLEKLGLQRNHPVFHQRVGPTQTVTFVKAKNQIAVVSI